MILQVLMQVFLNLDSPHDRRNVGLVCRSWNNSMNQPCLWKSSRIHLPTVNRLRWLRSIHWSVLHSRRISNISLDGLSPSTMPRILKIVSRNLPNLQKLRLELSNQSQAIYNLSCLTDLLKLECLSLSGSLSGGQVSVKFPYLPALKQLLIEERLSEIRFSKLFPALESLSMILGQHDTVKLANFVHLKSLSLPRSRFNGQLFISKNASLTFPSIVFLDMSCSRLHLLHYGDGVQQFFTRFPCLHSLNLANCGVCEEDLLIIVGLLTQLKELNLSG